MSNESPLVVRSFFRDDAERVMELYRHLSAGYVPNKQALYRAACNFSTRVLVAARGLEILRTATVSWRGVPTVGVVAYIDDVVVDPAYGGQGIAKALMNECVRLAKAERCARIDLTCASHRTEAHGLYRKLGFEQRETDVFVMKL